MSKKICIVTPDIIGPMKNGGIGTACYWLARFLAQNGYEVTALYTGPFANGTYEEVRSKYAEHQIEFLSLSEFKDKPHNYYGIEHTGLISERIYAFLRKQSFDLIHFQDWQGNGFTSIQAKTMGLAFAKTKLVVGVHSPRRWELEGMCMWSRDPIGDYKRHYMEKYAMEHADAIWAPSEAMFRWMETNKIYPRGEKRLIRYLIRLEKKDEQPVSFKAKDPSHLVFFGRLETRKGLEIFVESINKILNSTNDHGIGRITFLGKIGPVKDGLSALIYLNKMAEKWRSKNIEWKIIDTFDAFDAIRYIKKTGAIAIMPSLLDNYPYTILECVENQIPCLASSVGGIPEILSSDVIFDPTVKSLSEAILNRDARTQLMRSHYSNEQTKKDWLEYTESLTREETIEPTVVKSEPRVSICVAYYNYGQFLPQLLNSIQQNDYQNYEVIVVNDGSTDPFSVQVFEEQKKEFTPRGWKFITHENQGIGATRNFAASQADGDYLIFMDADNIAYRNMISTFVKSMTNSGADALSCNARVFRGDEYPDHETAVLYIYRPLGPLLEIGMLENVFGDANAIFRKKVFEEIGGFKTDRSTSFEDWQLFALLCLKGYKFDVVPEQLFFYRHQGESFSRSTNQINNQLRVMSSFLEYQDKIDFNELTKQVLVPLFYSVTSLSVALQAQMQKAEEEKAKTQAYKTPEVAVTSLR